MADKEIGALTAAAALGGTELAHVVQAGNSRKVTLAALKTWFDTFYEPVGGGGPTTIELSMFAGGKPTASEVLFRHEFTAATTIPAALADSQGSAGIAATASTVLTLKKNTTSIGTATWAASGTEPTLAAASPTSFAIGDVLSITAPASPDATLADISLSIVGSL